VVPKGDFSIEGLEDILKEELNIKEVEFAEKISHFQAVTIRPNHKTIGPRFKAKASAVAKALEDIEPTQAASMLEKGKITVEVGGEAIELGPDAVLVERSATGPYQVKETSNFAIVLDTTLTDELKAEGLARELNGRVQQARKDMALEVEQNIKVTVQCPDEMVEMLSKWTDYLKTETRATSFELGVDAKGQHVQDIKLEGTEVRIGLTQE
jgi:isoleucyl-tRNA synthetase